MDCFGVLEFAFSPSNVFNHACCAADVLIASRAKRKGSPCQRDDDSQGADLEIHSGPKPSRGTAYKILIMEELSTSQIP